MNRIELRLGLPTGSWIGDASRACPDATFRVSETIAAEPGDVSDVTVSGIDRERAAEALREHDRVDVVDVVDRRGSATALRVTGSAPPFVVAARRVGLPIAAAVEVTDGGATLPIAGRRELLTAFGTELATEGVTVGVGGSADEADRALTDAQRDLVLAAVDAGYYDTPRECTLTELAAERGIAKSTCSETLHRAEGRVMRRFVEGAFPFDGDGTGRFDSGRPDIREATASRGDRETHRAEVVEPGP